MLFLAACTPSPPPPPARIEPPPTPVSTEPIATPAPPLPAPAGPAFFAVEGKGIFRWDAAGIRAIVPLAEVGDMALVGETLWVIGDDALWVTDGDGMRQLTAIPGPAARGIAVAPDNRVWIAGFLDLHVWDGAALSTIPGAKLGVAPLSDVVVGPDGTVWVAGGDVVVSGDGETWTPSRPGDGVTHLADLVATADAVHAAYLGESIGLATWRAGAWTLTPDASGFADNGEAVMTAPDGRVVVEKDDSGAVLGGFSVDPDMGFTAHDVSAIAIDANDRMWLGTDLGLVVATAEGGVDQFSPGAIPQLDGRITRIRVAGGGPDVPRAGVVKGVVRGRALRSDGTAIAHAAVAICDQPAVTFEKHPCEAVALRVEGKTDEEGRFELYDIPFGSHSLLLGRDDAWTQVLMVGCCTGVRPDVPLDLGEIRIEHAP